MDKVVCCHVSQLCVRSVAYSLGAGAELANKTRARPRPVRRHHFNFFEPRQKNKKPELDVFLPLKKSITSLFC